MQPLAALARPKTGTEIFLSTLIFWNPLVAAALTFVLMGTQGFFVVWVISLAISNVVALLCYLGVELVIRVERAIAQLRSRPPPTHTTGFFFVVAACLMLGVLPFGLFVGAALAPQLGVSWSAPDWSTYRVGIGFGVATVAVYFYQRSRLDARDAARAAEAQIRDLENRRLKAQLAALSAEMNPHLLFNALNTIASLVHTQPDRAEEVTLELAELYRGALRAAHASTHSLEDELSLCRAYLKVEQARFGDRLGVEIEVAPSLDPARLQVPVLVLQPFVENAIRHGVAPLARRGLVRLQLGSREERLVMVVEDDGIGCGNSPHQGANRAIANCRERLNLAYGSGASLSLGAREGGGTRVVLELPIDWPASDVTHSPR